MKPLLFSSFMALLLLGSGLVARANDAPILIDGEYTLRAESYTNSGDPAAALYANTGAQSYGELNLGLRQRRSAYESVRASVNLLANDSAYRANNTGVQIERGQISWTKGDGALPFRLQAGDFLGYFSQRTLQRSLKGAQIELQPSATDEGVRQSLLGFIGVSDTNYRNFSTDNHYMGLSYLRDSGRGGITLNGNLVYNHRDSNLTLAERDQWVASLAAEREFQIGSQQLKLELEGAFFSGDYDNGTTLFSNRSDTGLFVNFDGRDGKASNAARYSLRLESYGQDYRPLGAAITADRKSVELRYSRPLTERMRLQARAQRFKNAAESINPSTTQILGANISGSTDLGGRIFSTQMDAFINTTDDRNLTTDTRTQNLRLGISTTLASRTTGRLDLSLTDADNLITNSGSVTRQLTVGIVTQRDWQGWQLSLSPTLGLVKVNADTSPNDQLTASLNLSARRGPHQLRMSLRDQRQDVLTAGGTDVDTQNLGLRYTFQKGTRSFGVEYDSQYRNPNPGLSSEGYRVALFFRQAFDHQYQGSKASREETGGASEKPQIIFPLAAGQNLLATQQRLRTEGYPEPIGTADALVYDQRLIPALDARQRVGVAAFGGDVTRIGLVIDPPSSRPDEIASSLSYVLDWVTRRVGPPNESIETGDFTGQLASDLRNGRFARLYHWEINGQQLRLGIPPRLDGRVRIELLQSLRVSRPIPEQYWGLQELAD